MMTLPNDNMQPTIGTDMVVLVDPNDNEIGLMEKMEAHKKGLLHRAFSFFIFNSKGEWLLQQRAWGNTTAPVCGPTPAAATPARRDPEGLPCAGCKKRWAYRQATPVFQFQYRSEFSNALIEHELDHVLIGYPDTAPEPNPEEVASYRYVSLEDLVRVEAVPGQLHGLVPHLLPRGQGQTRQAPTRLMAEGSNRTVIIGAGVAGMAAAIRTAARAPGNRPRSGGRTRW